MARGWESKSIKQQQADAAESRTRPSSRPLTASEQKLMRQRESLLLARKRLAADLASSTHPARRHMLEQSLAELDRQLQSFDQLTDPSAPK